ncbi:MAG: hypothetical protein KKA81_16620 [Bacteroidetes bacterium]|nr:hypothetical protein [Bacteroidota bacterium]
MADYPRSWNDDCPPITEAQKARHRVAERALPALIALFYAYVIASLLLQGGCIADDPSSGLDIPPGCQCVEPLEELDRRLREVETPGSGGRYTYQYCYVPNEGSERCSYPDPVLSTIRTLIVNYRRSPTDPRAGLYLEIAIGTSHEVAIPYPVTTGRVDIWWNAGGEPVSAGMGDIEVRDHLINVDAPLLSAAVSSGWSELRNLKIEVPVPPVPIPAFVPPEEW